MPRYETVPVQTARANEDGPRAGVASTRSVGRATAAGQRSPTAFCESIHQPTPGVTGARPASVRPMTATTNGGLPLEARRTLGRSDLRVAPLCLGGNVFGWTADEDASHAVLDAYVADGGNFVDTANAYSSWVPGHRGGESEAVIGRWLASRGRPDDLVVATKVGWPPDGLGRDEVRRGAEGALSRLGVERVDLLYAHRDDPETPLAETLAALDGLVREGLVGVLGLSNYAPERVREALELCAREGWTRPEVLQPPYNLIDREDFEGPLEDIARREELGCAPYFALARGFLTGKYRPGAPLPKSARASGVASSYLNDRGLATLDALDRVAGAHGAVPAQAALAWLMARDAVTAPIASATSAAQAHELAGAAALALSPDEIDLLTAAAAD